MCDLEGGDVLGDGVLDGDLEPELDLDEDLDRDLDLEVDLERDGDLAGVTSSSSSPTQLRFSQRELEHGASSKPSLSSFPK